MLGREQVQRVFETEEEEEEEEKASQMPNIYAKCVVVEETIVLSAFCMLPQVGEKSEWKGRKKEMVDGQKYGFLGVAQAFLSRQEERKRQQSDRPPLPTLKNTEAVMTFSQCWAGNGKLTR
jgi:hypothetical protein